MDKLRPAFRSLPKVDFKCFFRPMPTVTLLTIFTLCTIHMKGVLEPYTYNGVCINVKYLFLARQYSRFFLSHLVHYNKLHLIAVVISLFIKGREIETRFGSIYFAYLLLVFSVLINTVYILINWAGSKAISILYWHQCDAGFIALLVALKVLQTYYSGDEKLVINGQLIPVATKWLSWVELILFIYILPTRTSLTGPLSGSLIGLLYCIGPLKKCMDTIVPKMILERGQHKRKLSKPLIEELPWGGTDTDMIIDDLAQSPGNGILPSSGSFSGMTNGVDYTYARHRHLSRESSSSSRKYSRENSTSSQDLDYQDYSVAGYRRRSDDYMAQQGITTVGSGYGEPVNVQGPPGKQPLQRSSSHSLEILSDYHYCGETVSAIHNKES